MYKIKQFFDNLSGNPKDKTERLDKFGRYEINYDDYNGKYFSQRREVTIVKSCKSEKQLWLIMFKILDIR